MEIFSNHFAIMFSEEIRLFRLFHQAETENVQQAETLISQMLDLLQLICTKDVEQQRLDVYQDKIANYRQKLHVKPPATEKQVIKSTKPKEDKKDANDKLQERYTHDMQIMAKQLKFNALETSRIFANDKDKVRNTNILMQGQSEMFKQMNTKLRDLHGKYGSMCWMQVISIFSVMIVFIWTYLFIKFFRKRKYEYTYQVQEVAKPSETVNEVLVETITSIIYATVTNNVHNDL